MINPRSFSMVGAAVIAAASTVAAVPCSGEFLSARVTQDAAYQYGTNEMLLAEGDGDALLLASNGIGEEDRQELQELLSILEEETEVATKTKMNNDFVPGMVTVLLGEQLEALGMKTVAEALTLVPGIQMSRLTTGEPSAKVRGLAFAFNAGNVKVMLNSIALSRESSGINSSVLLIPVAQVERIEVIRGPGSSIYGDFAMAGVVNIITRDSGGRLFGATGDDGAVGGGGQYSYRDEDRDLGLSVNISSMDDGESAGPFEQDSDELRYVGIFDFDYKDFSFTAEGVQRRFEKIVESSTGAALPASIRKEEAWAMEGRQTVELPADVTLDAHLAYLYNGFDSRQPLAEFNGDRIETGVDLNWSFPDRHQMLFNAVYVQSDIDDAYNDLSKLRVAGIDRSHFSLGLQDQVALTERFSITFGVRFDDYDDVGRHWTPRIATVYRLGEHHVVKAQYSEGFRAPTFWELYNTGDANESLDFEAMDMAELSYIYRRPDAVGRVTLYYSEIDDGIYRTTEGGFENIADISAQGVEVEWEQRVGEKFRWQANISYNDIHDGRFAENDYKSPGIAPWLGNMVLFVQPTSRFVLTGRLHHVADRYASEMGAWIEGYDIVDLTVSRMDFWRTGITLRGGVKNVFDDDIVYITTRPDGLVEDEYRGRTWWLQVSYDF